MSSPRPNILLLMTDQQSASALSCAGNDDLSTPAVDSLAATGVRFERAYCTQPLCSPARASMFTGMMPSECGVPFNGMSIPENLRDRELGNLLSAAGYECVYSGKWHIPGGTVEPGHGFTRLGPGAEPGFLEPCFEFLRQRHDKPFFLVASFVNPHDICQWARRQPLPHGALAAPPDPEACPSLPANFARAPFEPAALRWEQEHTPWIYAAQFFSPEQWRQLRWAYYRLCEKVDEQIGWILQALREGGHEEETVVLFTSDHGDAHGAHQWNQKTALYEEIIRVPFVISHPGRSRAGAVDTHLVSNGLDLFATVCDYAGVDLPEGPTGRSVRPWAEGADDNEGRHQLLVETRFAHPGPQVTEGWALLTDRYKYCIYSHLQHREQFFDLAADPGEMVNLAVSARHAHLVADHRARLRHRLAAAAIRFPLAG